MPRRRRDRRRLTLRTVDLFAWQAQATACFAICYIKKNNILKRLGSRFLNRDFMGLTMQHDAIAPRPGATIPRSKAEIAAIHIARKRHAVQQAMRAPFFRGKLDHIDLDRLDEPREWAKIPLLDKDMLREHVGPGILSRLLFAAGAGRSHCAVLALGRHDRASAVLSTQPSRYRNCDCAGFPGSMRARAPSRDRWCIAHFRSAFIRSVP